MRGPLALASFLLLLATRTLPAQLYGDGRDGAFAPTADVTLDTTPNGGVFQFTSISIPAGVMVTLVGGNPAQFLCQRAVVIDGSVRADARGSRWGANGWYSPAGGPGGFDGGAGPGAGLASQCMYPAIAGGSASHATAGIGLHGVMCNPPAPTYGASLPFDLRGGSGGGPVGQGNMSSYGITTAGGGGGTIVILAGGSIAISGRVSANGGDLVYEWPNNWLFGPAPGTAGNGSGGSILLRSLHCVRVSGTVEARGGVTTLQNYPNSIFARGGDGFVRIDSYSACGAPDLSGATIVPAPLVAAMPHLTELEAARIGQTYRIRCASAPGDVLGLYLSFGRSSLPLSPFGVVELDPTLILFLGQFSVPSSGHDPLAAADVAIPNHSAIVGLTAYTQMFNAFGTMTGQARLSNLLTTRIGG